MIDRTHFMIFKRGSRTYFYSSLFLPPDIRNDVFTLYGFVRKADDFVDTIPQMEEEFHKFVGLYRRAIDGENTEDPVIDPFVALVRRRAIQTEWVDAFLESMECDLSKTCYQTMNELDDYLYGSAEVIGLMMAQIMQLSEKAHTAARNLGRAMQYINFVRDINEDLGLGRVYLPIEELQDFGIRDLTLHWTRNHRARFIPFMRHQIGRYCEWQNCGEEGYSLIPSRFLRSVKTAADMYKWTARQIWRNPYLIYLRIVKPSVPRVISSFVVNSLLT